MSTPADDYSEQSFYWHEFIHELAPLNAQTAMQYFEASPWYRIEPPSNNQILRMQNTGMDVSQINEVEQLRGLIGVEFAVAVDQGPSLFIIHKRRRVSPDEAHPLEAYYIINNHIQQAPSLYTLLSTRLNASVHHLMSSMSTLKAQKPAFTPTKGHAWPVLYDQTAAFVKGGAKRGAGGTVAGRSANGSTMEGDTPMPGGGSRASSVRPTDPSRPSDDNANQISINLPLLHAIRTTAAHVQRNAASKAAASDAPKRIVKSAMTLGMASTQASGASTDQLVASPSALAGAPASISGSSLPHVASATTHANVTGRSLSTPHVGMAAASAGVDGGTPLGERTVKKKKKRAATKDNQTPLPTRSPARPPA